MVKDHYILLSDSLDAFREEVRTTGQTIPFDSGVAVATLYFERNRLYVGINSTETPLDLRVTNNEGRDIEKLVEASSPKIDAKGELGRWYESNLVRSDGDEEKLLLHLQTA